MNNFDAIVIGAGPGAASAAITLCRRGAKIALIAGASRSVGVAGEVLSPEAVRELQILRIADVLTGSIPCYGIEAIWGQSVGTFHSYLMNPLGPGAVVDRREFHCKLLEAARVAGASVMNAQFHSAERHKKGWRLAIRHEDVIEILNGALLIDATGRSAAVARALRGHRRRLDNLCAVSAIFGNETVSQVIVVEAVSDGWWYLVPLPLAKTLLCFLSDADIIRRLEAANPVGWMKLLRKTSWIVSKSLCAANLEHWSFRSHPCESAILDSILGNGWAAVGDAAFTFDPLSSVGVLEALRAGRELGDAVASSLSQLGGTLKPWADRRNNRFAEYLRLKHKHYLVEQRWPNEPFWMRRHLPIMAERSSGEEVST